MSDSNKKSQAVIDNTSIQNDVLDTQEGDDFDTESFQATQNLIMRLGRQQDELSEALKQQREMLSNIFNNDEVIATAQVVADEASSKLKKRKTEIDQTDEAMQLKAKIKDLNEDLKLVKESLNNHLITYFQLTGSMALDLPDGQEREFSLNARLKGVKKSEK